jgi:hypothetical protein
MAIVTDQDPARLLLPEGTRLVHVGPPKTGTTTVQGAFDDGRRAIAAAGVHYAGPNRQPVNPVRALTGRADPMTGKPPPKRRWDELVREVKQAREPRALISSEFLADADPQAIGRLVDDLGADRTHIVVTLRPLARILPSQWQQYVQSGALVALDPWLDNVLHDPQSEHAKRFWRRHRADEFIARWASAAGPENVTVVVLDERDPSMVLRAFEGLLGLPTGILVAEADLENRSMTLAEVEVVRAFNILFRQEGFGTRLHHMVMRYGATSYMKARQPAPDEARVEIPRWANEEAGAIARTMVNGIVASGVRIFGDPEALTRVATRGRADAEHLIPGISPEIAARASVGVLIAGGLGRPRSDAAWRPADAPEDFDTDLDARAMRVTREPPDVVRASTSRLISVIIRRAVARSRDRRDAFVRRLRRAT